MSGPSFHLALPPLSLFKFPPDNLPPVLPPPSDEQVFKSPFAIDAGVYNSALHAAVPLTIAGCYIISVTALNAWNRSHGNKPWWISTTRGFHWFVVLHNVFLAVYSAATFLALLQAISRTWPGFDNGAGLAGVADSLCKLHGPRGLGDATTFNGTTNIWETKNKLIHLLPEGTPDPTDVGRLWNEGLAFWGWFFYLSKFYEVVDTLIIVAKGRRSATLQTFHHAGAMMCMWAGIRYMSPPIWMFVFVNSGIHALMYTYFTLSALGYRVPRSAKRALTTLQITQFLFGATYAAAHLFVKYDVPVSTAYTILHPISAASSVVSEMATSATDAIAVPSLGALIKRLLLRAAGDEGVAENVRDRQGQYILPGVQEAVQRYREETRYHTEYHTINCIDTSGEAFAIWLNLVYLAPLTVLFLRFFVRAYTHRSGAGSKQSKRQAASRASVDAAKGVDREIDDAGKFAERKLGEGAKNLANEVEKDLQDVRDGKYGKGARRVSERVESFERKVVKQVDSVVDALSPVRESVSKQEAADDLDEIKERLKSGADEAEGSAVEEEEDEEDVEDLEDGDDLEQTANEVKAKAKATKDSAAEKADDVKEAAKDAAGKAGKKAEEVKERVKEAASNAGEKAYEVKEEGKERVGQMKQEGEDTDGEAWNESPSKKKKHKKKKPSKAGGAEAAHVEGKEGE